ncbi:hypothetical protein [Couchioplanes caeruleus]|uniref:Uncharacterized protein n=2 Tax=Couchioplanes caeruleus TaxID=56438 RepID=A0A1K0GQM4_9ACTN|nr:hypothetical protein [Couchioplanes caeruleus]OJF11563.1 hypothetical protein BG844_25590 [Couchioplanes caeruleus subsp. caeruleus]ROP34222.1 hypothetical protein EDD30_7300 [Couchioplanes caeruleus]
MDDSDLFREHVLRHAGPVITGRLLGFQASYTREVKVGKPLVILVFLTASVAHALGSLVMAAVRGGGRGAARRTLKDLKKGPEYLVTPVRLRDDLGQVYEVEMHGQLPQSALHRGDLVQVRTVPQKDPDLPARLHQVINLETLQPYTPRIPTMWSHLGPGLLIQAALGLTVTAAVAAAWMS